MTVEPIQITLFRDLLPSNIFNFQISYLFASRNCKGRLQQIIVLTPQLALKCNLWVSVKISISDACPGYSCDVSSFCLTRKIWLLLNCDKIHVAGGVEPETIDNLTRANQIGELQLVLQILNLILLSLEGLKFKVENCHNYGILCCKIVLTQFSQVLMSNLTHYPHCLLYILIYYHVTTQPTQWG